VAAVGGERLADPGAGGRLHARALLAAQHVRRIRTEHPLRVENIAPVIPVAIVVARAIAVVEVAVHHAGVAAGAADARFEPRSLGVVAGAQTLGIAPVDPAVAVVVDTVTALDHLAGALGDVAGEGAAVVGDGDPAVPDLDRAVIAHPGTVG